MILLLASPTVERERIREFLVARGHLLSVLEPAAAQPAKVARSGIDTIVLDLGATDAIKFLRRYCTLPDRAPIICLADPRKPGAGADAFRFGAVDVMPRPLRLDDLAAMIANARALGSVVAPDAPVSFSAPGAPSDAVFGASGAMRDVLTLVRRVAASSCTVMIFGERGTGREMIARTIHAQSARAANPFVKIVSAAAAVPDVAAALDRVDGSTIYIENISELPTDGQAFLEAQLRERARAAFDAYRWQDAPRIIAGVQPRVYEWLERGALRRGLVDVLSVVRIDVPPLRQRPQDVPLLAAHFLKEACSRSQAPVKSFSPSAFRLLAALPWHGNAGELRSLCERLSVLVPSGLVLIEDVLANIRFDGVEAIGRSTETLREARERFERDYVTATLQQHQGRIGAAARQLGIERTNLYRKMKQLNVRWTGVSR